MSKAAREKRRRRVERQIQQAGTRLEGLMEKKTCVLCGGHGVAVGVWEVDPEIARQHLVAPGKCKVFFYMLCARHLYGHLAEVERLVLASWKQSIADAGPLLN